MKHLNHITLILFSVILFSCNTNTLKITDVQVKPDDRYSKVAERMLGKELSLVFYEKSLKLTIAGQKPVVLRLFPSGEYLGDGGTTLTITKSFGRISEVTYSLNEWQSVSVPFETDINLIAKP
ncbi:hypothetical protein [Mucilaginibacter sp.]|uniref:hypothetical protein n=1 Tax=Mucilaginibacter sp. TaxID=1882438 RepID=UPI0025F7A7AD|nr:hypothetical protein [Mucilaginibacter sp.]